MIPVVWLNFNSDAPNRGYWDQGLLEDLVAGRLGPVGHDYECFDVLPDWADGGVVIVPARQNAPYFDQVQETINRMVWVILILTGDEENTFPAERLSHPCMKLWVMTPQVRRNQEAEYLGSGTPPGMNSVLSEVDVPDRDLRWFFSGQITHARREECSEVLRHCPGGLLIETGGFTQGIPQDEYWRSLASAKVAPCPGGPESPDSFRLFEALEAGCVPVADSYSGHHRDGEQFYWHKLFGIPPFPVIEEWSEFPVVLDRVLAGWPRNANVVFSAWQQYKRDLPYRLALDVEELSGTPADAGQITVLMPTSPIPSNPSTEVIEETVRSVREQLPDAEILIMCDGVRGEQAERGPAYDEYVRRLTWLCNFEWTNVVPLVFEEHLHQGVMTRRAMDHVRTPLILFVEHDTPVIGDVPWEDLGRVVKGGRANLIRLHHEASILEPHEYLMLDDGPQDVNGVPLRATIQWSQRPHLASAHWYRHILNTYFGHTSRTMIEDVMYGVLETHHREEGYPGWNKFRVWIYTPEGDIKRSTHIDGRGGEPKYSMFYDYDTETPLWAPDPGVRE